MQLREMSKKQKLLIIVVAAVIGLLFYSNLVALNLIAVSQLSMYGAAAAAGALTVVAVILSFVGKQKSVVPKTVVKPVVAQAVKVEKSAPRVVERPVPVEKPSRTVKVETKNSYLQANQATVQPVKQQSVQPKEQPAFQFKRKPAASPFLKNSHFEKVVSTTQQPREYKTDSYLQARHQTVESVKPQPTQNKEEPTVKHSYIDKPVIAPKEIREPKNGKLKCHSCGKEFSQPILMADYSNPDQPDLVPHCPYCFKPLNSQLEVTTEEIAYKKYV